jgi:hypothetical protein
MARENVAIEQRNVGAKLDEGAMINELVAPISDPS